MIFVSYILIDIVLGKEKLQKKIAKNVSSIFLQI